jgi:parvulin-like peptidyl-prolyl isomerase
MRQMLYDEKIVPRISVSEKDIEDYYNSNLERFAIPENITIQQILFTTDRNAVHRIYGIAENAPEELIDSISREKAEMVYEKIKNGADFSEMAGMYSDDSASGKMGGRIGMIYRGQYEPAFDTIAFDLPADSVSPPFKTAYGFHIIKILSHQDSGYAPLDSGVSMLVRGELEGEQARKEAARYFDSLIAVTDIVYNEDFIKDDSGHYDSSDWVIVFDQQDTVFYPEYKRWEDRELQKDPRIKINSRFRQELLYQVGNAWLLLREARTNGYQNSEKYAEAKKEFLFREKLNRLMAERNDGNYEPDSAEIEAYYRAHPEQFSEDSSISIQQVILENEQLAKEVKAKVDSGANFYETAMEYYPGEEEEIKKMAVNLGWIKKDEISPEFFNKIYKLDVGAVSEPIKTEWGYHVVKVLGKKGIKPLNTVKLDIRKALISEHKDKILKAWQERMLEGVHISIDKDLLAEFIFHKEWLPKPDLANMFPKY